MKEDEEAAERNYERRKQKKRKRIKKKIRQENPKESSTIIDVLRECRDIAKEPIGLKVDRPNLRQYENAKKDMATLEDIFQAVTVQNVNIDKTRNQSFETETDINLNKENTEKKSNTVEEDTTEIFLAEILDAVIAEVFLHTQKV